MQAEEKLISVYLCKWQKLKQSNIIMTRKKLKVVTSPLISVKLRDPSECIEEFFNKHIKHYKIINKKYYEGQLIERGNSCSILDISKRYTLSNNQETQTSNLQISSDDMTLNANIAHATDNSTDGETSATETTANTNTSNFLDL
ncbi:hypothetical protein J6590_002181 [Homalodisca vitripennis]|nr:hypothetical protein J6590_002181 [Homalodisca vitripennis]